MPSLLPTSPASPPLGPVVLVEDDAVTRRMMRAWLESADYSVVEFDSGARALAELPNDAAVVCLDLGLDDMPGLDVLRHLHADSPDVPVLVVTANATLQTAVAAMRSGAQDYLVKPLDKAMLLDAVARAAEQSALASNVRRMRESGKETGSLLVGRSSRMRELATQIQRIRESDVTVCVFGESGTGKELVARTIHDTSRRRRGPFVAINCAAIAPSLQESELFGHERGAFTGAAGTHRGRFEQASEGTLFLDELGEMSAATQASLLRALQERTIRRVGGVAEIPVNVRIVCATHRDLAAEVAAGRFREDLYFRLVVYPITVPPLRDRVDDIPLLVGHFLERLGRDVGREINRVSADALAALAQHPWPGNVRELQNVMHRAMLACEGDEIRLSDLPPELRTRALPPIPAPRSAPAAQPAQGAESEELVSLAELENRAIQRTLRASGGNVSRAAAILGIGRATLYRRLMSLGLVVAEK